MTLTGTYRGENSSPMQTNTDTQRTCNKEWRCTTTSLLMGAGYNQLSGHMVASSGYQTSNGESSSLIIVIRKTFTKTMISLIGTCMRCSRSDRNGTLTNESINEQSQGWLMRCSNRMVQTPETHSLELQLNQYRCVRYSSGTSCTGRHHLNLYADIV